MGCVSSKDSYEPVTITKPILVEKTDSSINIPLAPPLQPPSQAVSVPQDYVITYHRWISLMQSIIPHKFSTVCLLEMEKDIGYDMDAFYQRLIAGKTRISCKVMTEQELYVYAGVVGLYYGPTSHKFDHITTNLVQYSKIDIKQFKPKLTSLYSQCTKPVEYTTSFDKNDITVVEDDVTMLLLSNFGTGMVRAQSILEEARRVAPEISLLLVAGDTYYSGTVEEQEKNALQPIHKVFPHALVRYLRGSHDMYSGPEGYLHVKKQIGQTSSYFSVRNRHLMIQGMDTTFREAAFGKHKDNYMTSLRDDELEWHTHCVHEASQQKKKIILFSYHEPITYKTHIGLHQSTHPPVNVPLLTQLSPLIPSVDAYYFGHHHALMLYEDYKYNDLRIKKPRLIGHGGSTAVENVLDSMYAQTPGILDTSTYPVPTLVEGDEWHLRHNGEIMDSGFCILRCKDGMVTAEYYNIHFTIQEHEPAVCVYQETL